jgi:hypothetical protein
VSQFASYERRTAEGETLQRRTCGQARCKDPPCPVGRKS